MNNFVHVYSEEDKVKLIALSYEFICAVPQGKITIYQFRDNNSQINFNDLGIKHNRSNFMLF